MTGRVIITPYNIELETKQSVIRDGYPITGFNLPPGQPLSILRYQQQYELVKALWGFTPQWLKDLKRAPYVVRIESLESSPMYTTWVQTPCLLPVTGYYLWKQARHIKQPFAIRRPENRPFFLAGIWTRYRVDRLTSYESFALISCPAPQKNTPLMSERIPIALAVDHITTWLAPETSAADALQLLQTSKVDLECYPVSALVNSPHNTSIEVTHSLGQRQRFVTSG